MAASKGMKSLFKASAASADKDNQHIVLSISSEGTVFVSGTDNMVTGIVEDAELFMKVKACMKSNLSNESVGYSNTYQLAYDPLPCSPFSPEWKALGNEVIRGLLRRMFITAGYGRGKSDKKLGVGPAPVGWPEEVDWNSYKGSTRSGLKVSQVTHIIVSMLQAAGFDANTHVKSTEEATAEVAAVEGITKEGTAQADLAAQGTAGETPAREREAGGSDASNIDDRVVTGRVLDEKVLPVSEEEAEAMIGEHIVEVVSASGSAGVKIITHLDSQDQDEFMNMQEVQVPQLLPNMLADKERSEEMDNGDMLVKQAGVKRKRKLGSS